MITEIPITPEISKRYRRLAGPFTSQTEHLLSGLLDFLLRSGARAITVREPIGLCVRRLRSECETCEQTERRLTKQKRQGRHKTLSP